jgi:hypothetical protein
MPNAAFLQYTLIATPGGSAGAFIRNSVGASSLDANVTEIEPGNNTASDTDPIGEGIFFDGFEHSGSSLLRPPIGH